jgi:hypothetical protein
MAYSLRHCQRQCRVLGDGLFWEEYSDKSQIVGRLTVEYDHGPATIYSLHHLGAKLDQ